MLQLLRRTEKTARPLARKGRGFGPLQWWKPSAAVAVVAAAAVAGIATTPSAQSFFWPAVTWSAPDAAPAFRTLRADPVTPVSAFSLLGGNSTSTNGLCRDYSANSAVCPGGARPRSPEIRELARALRNDPDLIYAYVRNGVDTEFQFGLAKGELGALIDRSGTPFDQAKLLVELLREAGFTARYKFGDIQLSGAQLHEWLGTSDARAACTILASGGVPVQITASGGGSGCNLSGTVTTIVIGHVWVEADIQGQSALFDPSYKPYEHLEGVDVRAAAGVQTGDALSTAIGGVVRTNGGATTRNYNAAGLKTWLENRATTLRDWMRSPTNQGLGIKEIVGGRRIIDAVRPSGGWRQTSLGHIQTTRATWTTGIPDAYRTRLQILYRPGHAPNVPLNADLFSDEMYGRPVLLTRSGIKLDNIVIANAAISGCPGGGSACVVAHNATITLDRPFAANSGTFADSSISRSVKSIDGAAIVLGLGNTSRAMSEKWTRENPREDPLHIAANSLEPRGDSRRLNTSAEWLAQFSHARNLHQRLAGAEVTHLHSLGVIYAISNPSDSHERYDLADVLDIESAVAITTLDGDAPRRRALIHALATTAATLEGSVPEQLTDSPDSSSTARRVTWGNNPSGAPGVQLGQVSFYALPAGSAAPAASAFTEQEAPMTHIPTLRTALAAYLGNGFSVTTAADAHLGPGRPWGQSIQYGDPNLAPSNERGGAFVATRYDGNGDPVEIAHVVTNYWTASKGGGAGTVNGPPNPSEVLRDGFQDRSAALGVSLADGSIGYSTPVLRSVGQGEFPHRLEERLELVGGQVSAAQRGYANVQTIAHVGLVSNFMGSVTQANSGYDAMGSGRPEAAAETLVAFIALQDVYSAAASADRDISGLLAADWWGRQMIHNVVRVAQGGRTETYVEAGKQSGKRLFLAGGGSHVLLNGELDVVEDGVTWPTLSVPRRYKDNGLTYEVIGGDGSKRTYELLQYDDNYTRQRLKNWEFREGITLTLAYGGIHPVSVANNLGVSLTLSTVPAQAGSSAYTWPNTYFPCAPYSSAPATTYSVQDAAGQVHKLRFRQPVAQTLHVRPDWDCRLDAVYSPRSATLPAIQYTFDSLNRVKEARDAIALATPALRGPHQFFVAEGFRSERQDPLGGRYATESLRGGREGRHIDEEGRVSSASFDGRGRVTSRTTAWGNRTEFEYDDRDNVIELRRLSRQGCGADVVWCQSSTTTATYHPTWNKPLTITLPATYLDGQAASTWTFAYDSQGRLETQTSPVVYNGLTGGHVPAIWRTWYDAYGRVTQTRDPTGIEATMTYGGYGQPAWCLTRQTASTQSGGFNQISAFTCNAAGDVTTATDPRGNVTTTTWDALRRMTAETGPAGTNIQTQWTYDADGNTTEERRWDSTASVWRTATTTYSLTGKPLTVTDPAGDVMRTCYDELDRATVAVDPSGRATRTSYNLASQPTLVERWFTASPTDATCALTNTRPAHLSTNRWRGMEYNSGGLQSAEIDGNGNATTMTYDGLGRHMVTTYADGKYTQNIRNERDQIYVAIARSGDYQHAFYDAMGRAGTTWEHTAGAAWPLGRVTSTAYDLASRTVWTAVSTQVSTPFDEALQRDIRSYGYDAAGRVQFDRITPNNGTMGSTQQVLTYGYDQANNRTSIQWPDGYVATYRFDAANRTDRVTFGAHQADIALDSLSRRTSLNRSNWVNTAYAYEADSDLAQINHAWAPSAGQTPATFGFQHDPAGRITGLSINRPDLEWMPSLAYAQTYGAPTNLNQTTSRNGVALSWSDNGNLLSYGSTTYEWTWGNRLARVIKPGSTTEYAYDSRDRRTVVIEDGLMTRTLWLGADEVAEYDLAGVLKRRFIPDGSGSMDARLATVNPDNTIHWHHTDHQGSVIATSNAVGQAAGFTNYSPHGEFGTGAGGVPLTAPPTGSPFGYTGRQWDAKAGLYQYRARYYSPELGIFLSMDPIGTKDDPNLYMYVGLDPTNNTDPTGNETHTVGRNWVVNPDDSRISGFSIPRPWLAVRDLNRGTPSYHAYTFSHVIRGAGQISDAAWERIMAANSVPNPIRRPATEGGTRNDAALPVPFNSVNSYTRRGADGRFTTVNVTRRAFNFGGYGIHIFSDGFVATQSRRTGRDRELLTYGEGNSWMQDDNNIVGKNVGSPANAATWQERADNVQSAVNEEIRRMRDNDQRH
jgi:RHS repeat-associated protein